MPLLNGARDKLEESSLIVKLMGPPGSDRMNIFMGMLPMAYGVFLRCFQYLSNYSLHLDECSLAINLFQRNFRTLNQVLTYNQAAPLGFLYGEKALMLSVGSSPLVMRSIPFLCSLLAIVAFYRLARTFFSGLPLLLATALFCANQSLIFYSATLKQYSVEVLVTIVLFLLLLPLFEERPPHPSYWVAGISSILIWFSFSAIFVLAGIGVVLTLYEFRRKLRGMSRLALVLVIWIATFLPFFWYSIRPGASNQVLAGQWTAEYLPLNPIAFVGWMRHHLAEVSAMATTWRIWPIAGILLVAGVCHVMRTRNWKYLALLAPVIACLTASALRKYPFSGRLVLFLMPTTILFITAGYKQLVSVGRVRILAHSVTMLLMLWCCLSAGKTVLIQRSHLDSPREVMGYVRDHWQAGDRIYVNQIAEMSFLFYNWDQKIPPSEYTLHYAGDAVLPGRVWFFYFRTPWLVHGEYEPALTYLRQHGTEIAQFNAELHSAILFSVEAKNVPSHPALEQHNQSR